MEEFRKIHNKSLILVKQLKNIKNGLKALKFFNKHIKLFTDYHQNYLKFYLYKKYNIFVINE